MPQMESVAKSDANDDRKLVLAGDFAINSRSDRKQSCGVSSLDGSVSLINLILYVKDKSFVYANYLNYLLKNYGFAEEFYKWGHGIVADLWTTRWQEMKSIVLPLPTALIQQNIAAFLDKKLAEVDKLIEVQQAQIEKLKEYKQSVITEAVTKGLDPSAPMKDSGIEWLGKIQTTFLVEPLKFLLCEPMMYGANEKGDKTKEYYRYIRITDIESDGGLKESDDNQYLTHDVGCYYELRDGDVLFARSGGTVGKSFIFNESYGKCAFAGYLIKASCNVDALLPEYLYYYTQSSIYERWKNSVFIQATIQNIGANKFSMLPIVICSIDEQSKIVYAIKNKCAKIDKLIALKQEKIEKLNEYKKSLIYEYVTGKKEVV